MFNKKIIGMIIFGGIGVYYTINKNKKNQERREFKEEYLRIITICGVDIEKLKNDPDYDIPKEILEKIKKEFAYYDIDIENEIGEGRC